jgi:hypothetical protein
MAFLDFYVYQEQCQRDLAGNDRNPGLRNQTIFRLNREGEMEKKIEWEERLKTTIMLEKMKKPTIT